MSEYLPDEVGHFCRSLFEFVPDEVGRFCGSLSLTCTVCVSLPHRR